MPATDEQIERVRRAVDNTPGHHGGQLTTEALVAVLDELTTLRAKVDDQANSLKHAAEEVEALRELRDAVESCSYGRISDALKKCQK